jgi:Flp pilus assembly protein TadG
MFGALFRPLKTKNLFARFRRERRGSLALMMALALAAIGVAIGLAIDFSNAVSARAKLQNALDAAVLAAAADTSSDWKTSAQNVLAAQLRPAEVNSLVTDFERSADGVVTGAAERQVETYFAGLLATHYVNVAVEAMAGGKADTNPVCILLKSPNASQALLVNSGANVKAPNCEIHVSSTANPAAIFNSQSNIQTSRLCVAGKQIIDNGGNPANLEKECTPASDPYAGNLPTPDSHACTLNGGNWNGGTVNMMPGVYCGWFNFNDAPTVNFEPGVYVIKNGGFNVNGGVWNGDGVTFYFADSSMIQFNSAVKTYLSAPKTGTYAGILMYEAPMANQSNFVLNNSTGHALEGLIYLPSRNMTVNSGHHATLDRVTLVANTLILNSMEWSLGPGEKKPLLTSGVGASMVRLLK